MGAQKQMGSSCIRSLLKVVNSGMLMVGIAMILYACWMFRVWHKHLGPPPYPDAPAPWFIYTFLGVGVSMCLITCSGHIAAETANGCCLSFYNVLVFLLLMIEAAVTADVMFNHNWEQDFPDDITGKFDEFTNFVKENFGMCKWIGLSVVAVQGLSLLLSMILKALVPYSERYYYEIDDDYTPERVPFLRPPPKYAGCDPLYGLKNDSWNIKIDGKQVIFAFNSMNKCTKGEEGDPSSA